MRMVWKINGQEVQIGDFVDDDRLGRCVVSHLERPRSPASSGRLYVKDSDGHEHGYFPHVFDAEWIEREDRE